MSKELWLHFPTLSREQKDSLQKRSSYQCSDLSHYPAPYFYQGERFEIPYRLGYHKSESFSPSNPTEEAINWCLLSRHHDGFIREKATAHLIRLSSYPFVVPYLLRINSEYILSIMELIYEHRDTLDKDQLISFRDENPLFIATCKRRAASYWNAYFRDKTHIRKHVSILFLEWVDQL